jgi:hypothetical protein
MVTPSFVDCLADVFPLFAQHVAEALGNPVEAILPPATGPVLDLLEQRLGFPLPESYKQLLRCARGFWLRGGLVQLGPQHPFVHEFPSFYDLSPRQQQAIVQRGGQWPPPTHGMVCFAEYHRLADGDQVLFDISQGLVDGEYPVFYYDHEANPPATRKLADSFAGWLNGVLESSG